MGLSVSNQKTETSEVKPEEVVVKDDGDGKKKKELSPWKKVVREFEKQVLDPAYIAPPIRSSIIEAAAQYVKAAGSDGEYLLPGTHKHLGGAYDPTDGSIYGVPANSRAVLCLHPETNVDGEIFYKMKAIALPESVRDTKMKWLRGIFAHGCLWAMPAWADSVLCVDIDAYHGRRPANGDIVQLLPLPAEHPKGMVWQWHGGALNKDKTAIYCVPSNAKSVLKVDLQTKKTSLIQIEFDVEKYPTFDIDLSNKFYGAIFGEGDGCIYGVPYRSCAVLRIDCENDSAELVGPDYGAAGYNWHGGIQANGKIYAHPSHADDTVLVINTNADCPRDKICEELQIKRAEYDQDPRKNYKWLGGAFGADGHIYCPACDTSSILKIDTETEECTTFGFAGKLKNKWQGGLLSPRDECIYCIPADGHHILRIATSAGIEGENPIQLLGDIPHHKDKWQGGSVGKDGCLYFVPENGYRVMKVTPPLAPPKIVDGKLPVDDVVVEMM